MKRVLLFLLGCSAIAAAANKPAQFFGRRDYPGGADQVQVADVNGDGIPDLVTISFGPNITSFFGNGNGTFRKGRTSSPGMRGLGGMVAIDLNGDGKVDLVVSGNVDGLTPPAGIGVLFGNGDGTFQPAVVYQAGSDRFIGYLAMGDFNGDGIPDAVTVGESGIWLFTGKGGGVFNPGVLTPVAGLNSAHLVAADFNGDGKLDLAVTTVYGFVVVLGNGNGTFQAPVTYKLPMGDYWIAAGAAIRGGYSDIIIAHTNQQFVYLYFNNGKGVFSSPIEVALPGSSGVAIGDVNGDGLPDLIDSAGFIAFGEGGGRFTPPVSYAVESSLGPENVVLADLRKIGVLDIVAAQYDAVSVLLSEGKGYFKDAEWISVSGAGSCAAAADFNGDGKPDLAVPTSNGIVILFGTGKASAPYSTGPTIPLSGPGCPVAGDLTGKGTQDILVGANSLGGVGAYLNNGAGTFTLASVVAVNPGILVFGDFNHDGKLDFADSSNQLALGNGDGTFQPPVSISSNPPPMGFTWIASGDINNDGWTDLAATQWDGGDGLYILLNNHQGGFTQGTIANVAGPQGVALADLNLDGNLDAVVWPCCGPGAIVYLGDGKGGFTLQKQYPAYPGTDTIMLAVGDVNGDGIPDLLLPADGSLGIAYGTGKGTFSPTIAWGLGGSPGQILLENLHGQLASANLPDIVSPDSGGGVTVLINTTKN